MTDRERIIRLLTIEPGDLRRWTRACQKVCKELYLAHPEYPRLNEMRLTSFVKRLLPEIRAVVANLDASPDAPTN